MNVGIREALERGADRVLLVNSDVIVPPDAIERLEQSSRRDAARRNRGAGGSGPIGTGPDRLARHVVYAVYRPHAASRHRPDGSARRSRALGSGARSVDGVSGCLMLVKREVFEAVGFFDEAYFFSFEDLDFCLKARRAGFATILAEGATIYHEGGQSLGPVSPRRFYFAARNHLLLARRAEPSAGRFASILRGCSIVMLNLAHAVVSRGGSLPSPPQRRRCTGPAIMSPADSVPGCSASAAGSVDATAFVLGRMLCAGLDRRPHTRRAIHIPIAATHARSRPR